MSVGSIDLKLGSGHAPTLYASMRKFSRVHQMWYECKLLRLSDGGTLGLDFAPVDTTDLDDRQIIVVVPGSTGGKLIRPTNLNHEIEFAQAPTRRPGVPVLVTSPRLYTAGHTDDLTLVLIYIS
ncbi:hypothetical protein DFH08DRAFT_974678 [Mycena albidolilacea]|uniref:Uncharacterized protein n=1 Tax=Mycena albidolilacea TaxID=1033008 RepID=A0AAD7EBL8_9AGAR|nr:hypothetical protein DFH08DRAFT_974678 [Mycena albidolilacea]